MKGYQQLEGIAQGLHQVADTTAENEFLQRLILQVDRTLAQNQTLAAELEETHGWLRKVATCLRYPPSSYSEAEWQKLTSQQVTYDMENLLKQLRQESKNKASLSKFYHGLSKRWKDYGPELLHCYDISGLPRTICNSKVFSTSSVATNAVSVDVAPPKNCATLANFRPCSWLTAKPICSNRSAVSLWKSTRNVANA